MKQNTFTFLLLSSLVCFTPGCREKEPDTTPEEPSEEFRGFKPEDAFPALSFSAPIEFTHAGDGSEKVYVAEQAGLIRVFENQKNVSQAQTFLDIRSRVASGGETGLLGLTFHPSFRSNGYFFVNYTRRSSSQLQTVISRFKTGTNGMAEASSEAILLTFDQPYSNHNGGKIAFGPDGYLYIATGDGGSGGDPQNNAQNLKNLLGKILRIDVNSTQEGNYGVPSDNPFVTGTEGNRKEIYAYGLRNPWKFSFEAGANRLWLADVGQNEIEEIDLIVKGGNYGWKIKEGNECYANNPGCSMSGLISPVYSYRQGSDGRSITGGFVYKGKKYSTELDGKYVFGDYVSGKIWALNYTGNSLATDSGISFDRVNTISSFGEDADGELYVLDHGGGKIYGLVKK